MNTAVACRGLIGLRPTSRQLSGFRSPLSSASSPTAPPQPTPAPDAISWQDYFGLKKSRKNWERSGAIVFGLTGFLGGSFYFGAVAEFDPLAPVFGVLEPNIAYGGASFLVGVVGLLGGMSGTGLAWRVAHKRVIAGMDAKETEFFHRIAKYRPKEIKMNLQHPLPDYYGERISSASDYRKWLRATKEWCVKMGINQKS